MSDSGHTTQYEHADQLLNADLCARVSDALDGTCTVVTFGGDKLTKTERRLGEALAREVRAELLDKHARIGARLYFRGTRAAERDAGLARAGYLVARGYTHNVASLLTGYSRQHIATKYKAVVMHKRTAPDVDPGVLAQGLAVLRSRLTPLVKAPTRDALVVAIAKHEGMTTRAVTTLAMWVGLAARDLDAYDRGRAQP